MAEPAKNGAEAVTYTVPFVINGEEVRSEATFDVVNPATAKPVHRCVVAYLIPGPRG